MAVITIKPFPKSCYKQVLDNKHSGLSE